MAFTPAEEDRLRALLQQDTSLITLAQNEPAIIQELGAQDVTIQDLQLASSLLPTDKIIGRFGGDDKAALLSNLADFVKSILKLNRIDYGAPLIGSLIYWPLSQMPQELWPDMNMEFIPYMQQPFDPIKYPLLKVLHPSGVLPADARGEFIRGWDNGRGVDVGRDIMTHQGDAMRNLSGTFSGSGMSFDGAGGVFSRGKLTTGKRATTMVDTGLTDDIDFSTAGIVPEAGEFRPRSINPNVITRAK